VGSVGSVGGQDRGTGGGEDVVDQLGHGGLLFGK
jgi:hypothetical protein